MHFNGRFVANLMHFAAQQGVEMNALETAAGRSLTELQAESCTIGAEPYNAVVETAVRLSGDVALGLHAGEYLNLSAAGVVHQIVQSCGTVRQALDYVAEFANLGCAALPMRVEDEHTMVRVSIAPDPLWLQQSPVAVQQTADGMMAFTIRQFNTLTRNVHQPVGVESCFERTANLAELQRVFDCPISFGHQRYSLLLAREHAMETIVTSDFQLLQILVDHANSRLAAMQERTGFTQVVKRSVLNLVKPEFPSIEMVAANLNLSVRSLQRRLKQEGRSYKEILEELKEQFAESYLRQPELSISEVAYLLSYNDPSAFIRSFKRWKGMSPGAWRENQ